MRPKIAALEAKLRRIPYIDPIDIRYRRFENEPKPVAQAVMFCLMDVSGSMSEHMKDLAKRFYMLLYIFLTRRYRHVEIVFIRHTDQAEEVDEETFFRSPATGGTMVSSALEAMRRIVATRYRPADWNIYAAQASDGDNSYADGAPRRGSSRMRSCRSASISPISKSAMRASRLHARTRRCGRSTTPALRRGLAVDAQGQPPQRDLPGVPRALPAPPGAAKGSRHDRR